MTVLPYKEKVAGKKEQVADMFNSISKRYDFLNHFLSLGIDRLWRKKAIRILKKSQVDTLLDVATGTGDFAIEALALNPSKVTGIDISEGMLEVGREKMSKRGLDDRIEMMKGDSEDLPFADNAFDAITVGFGVRNFENLEKGLGEMLRVLDVNGTAVILEFSKPSAFPIKQIYQFYFHRILPGIGRMVSKDPAAYTYLPESVDAFPEGEDFLNIMKKTGYSDCYDIKLMFGIASIYVGKKIKR